jgi:hypothetical protein
MFPLEFKNKDGKSFYVKATKTKTGKVTYVITKQLTEECVTELPDSYEVIDIPTTGQLVVRKKLLTAFTDIEKQIIENELKKNKALYFFKIGIRGNTLSIYTKQFPEKSAFKNLERYIPLNRIMDAENFEELMRVKLETNGDNRNYTFERYNFRGSYNDWMAIGSDKNLKDLAQKFIKHIGHESYFEIGFDGF